MGQESFGQALRRLRESKHLNQGELANMVYLEQKSISRYERGSTCPPETVRALDQVLDARGELILAARLLPDCEPIGTVGIGPIRGMLAGPGDRAEAVSQTERRDAIGVMGLGLAGSLGPHLLDQSLEPSGVSPERLAWIENETQAIAHQIFRVADQRPLMTEALDQFRIITTLLGRSQRSDDRRRLVRSAANASGTIGAITHDLGDERAARDWLWSSHSAALDAGDPYLADMALVTLAFTYMYEDRPRYVLATLTPRLDRPIAHPNQATAKLYGIAARASANLGDRTASHRYLATAQEALDRASQPDMVAWECFDRAQLEFHAGSAALAIGDYPRAIEMADRAIADCEPGWPDFFYASLDKALALHQSGDVDEACRVATRVITDPDLLVTDPFMTHAARLDQRFSQSRGGPVAEWRDAYQARKARELTA